MVIVVEACHPLGMGIATTTLRASLTLILSLLLLGCGGAGILDGVGDATSDYVKGDVTTTSVVVVVAGTGDEKLVDSSDVGWFNDEIEGQVEGAPDDVIRGVWERELNSRFVQSSRSEIAAALPEIMFPGLVPEAVQWVTSQLVYDENSGVLDPDTTAAFGLWVSAPYQSESARVGVLRVGRAASDILPTRSGITPIIVPDGISLGWTESGHRYELFCRSDISEGLCTDIANSSVLLSDLLP